MLATADPLVEAYAPVAAIADWVGVRVGGSAPGTVALSAVAGDALEDALDLVRRERTGDADDRTVGAAVVDAVASVVGQAAVAMATQRRVALLDPARVRVRAWTEARPAALVLPGPFACLAGDAAAAHPDAVAVAGEDALWERLCLEVERACTPVVMAVFARTWFAIRAQWALVSVRVAGAVAQAWTALGDPRRGAQEATRAATAVERLMHLRPTFYVLEHRSRACVGVVAAACCRAYRWRGADADYCTSCPLRPHEERLTRMRTWMAEHAH